MVGLDRSVIKYSTRNPAPRTRPWTPMPMCEIRATLSQSHFVLFVESAGITIAGRYRQRGSGLGIRGTTLRRLQTMRACLTCESTGGLDDSGAEYLGTRNTAVHAHRFNPAAQSEQVIFIYRVARLSLRKRHGWVERLSPVPACLNNMSNASALGIP